MFNQEIAQSVRHHGRNQIVCLSSTRWDFLWQRPQQIMSRLSRTYDVLYVDPALPVYALETDELTAGAGLLTRRLRKVHDSLLVFSPQMIAKHSRPDQDPESLHAMNAGLLARQLGAILTLLRWQTPLFWAYDPQACLVLNLLPRRGVVYDCVDCFPAFSWADPLTAQWDREMMAKADVVLTSALALYQERNIDGKATFLVPNAADYAHFAQAGNLTAEAPELAGVRQPRLGFIGAVYEWVDLDLLATVAEAQPDWQLVMIGPAQHGLVLPERPNIHWLGPRDYRLLPMYLQGLSVMLIPFHRNEVTDHTNPIKMWEYLAAGKPIVATMLPEIPEIPGVIWQCETPEEFIEGCASALGLMQDPVRSEEISCRARAVARANSWDERCKQIKDILAAHFGF
ncbi:MAG: glycosyltransferase [Bacteroidota bacterium]